jgi:hypothetical protein
MTGAQQSCLERGKGCARKYFVSGTQRRSGRNNACQVSAASVAHAVLGSSPMRQDKINGAATETAPAFGHGAEIKARLDGKSRTDGRDA